MSQSDSEDPSSISFTVIVHSSSKILATCSQGIALRLTWTHRCIRLTGRTCRYTYIHVHLHFPCFIICRMPQTRLFREKGLVLHGLRPDKSFCQQAAVYPPLALQLWSCSEFLARFAPAATTPHSRLLSDRLLTYLLRMLGGKCLGRLATEVVGHGGNNLSFKAQHIKT